MRAIVNERDADLFQSRADAETVVSQMHSLKRAGIMFSVEPVG